MPSTYTKLHYHIVFSVKHRIPLIERSWETDLHAYLGGCIKKAAGVPVEIGGYRDHVHILAGLRATHQLSKVVCDIKSGSSAWVHQRVGISKFAWQEGYAALTASTHELDALRRYIQNQEEHHRTRSFLEEYREMLDEMGMELDERYLS